MYSSHQIVVNRRSPCCSCSQDVAHKLLSGEPASSLSESFENATICFIKLNGYKELVETKSANEVLHRLDKIYSAFDYILDNYPSTYKIETIGNTYLIASGLPMHNSDHAANVVDFCFLIRELCKDFEGEKIEVQIGVRGELVFMVGCSIKCLCLGSYQINSGPVTAGVIGTTRCFYRVFGDTVNIASRMMSHGDGGKIHCTEATRNELKKLIGMWFIGS